GSASRRDGHPRIIPTFSFQARASRRRTASSTGLPQRNRYSLNRSTMVSSTSFGATLFAEQKRMKDDSRERATPPLIFARNSAQAGDNGAPCSGIPFSRANQSNAAFALLLWFCNVLAVRPLGAW